MTGNDLAHRRMRSLRLSGAPFDTPEEVVRWLGAAQSQDYGPAKWAIAQRASAVGDTAMDKAFADGTILRTHVLRPTWHFVLPSDIRWMLELTAPRVHALNAYYYRQLALEPAILANCTALIARALRGGNQLTRNEINGILAAAGIATDGFRLAYILMNAELNGTICSGALDGKQHTYALLDERAPNGATLSRDEALAELTVRYFTSHGPATAKDFTWWSSLTLADVRRGLEMAASQLECEVVDGVTYWFADDAGPPDRTPPTVHLLQAYDEYTVGYSESKYVLDASGNARALPRDRPVFNQVIILDSQVAGCWKRTLTKNAVSIEAALYEPFDDAQRRALRLAADRYAEFLGLPVEVSTLR